MAAYPVTMGGGGSDTLAKAQIDKVTTLVLSKLGLIQDWAFKSQQIAEGAIDDIGLLEVTPVSITFPNQPALANPNNPATNEIPTGTVGGDPTSVAFTPTGQLKFTAPNPIPQAEYGTPVAPGARPSPNLPLPPVAYPQVALTTPPTAPNLQLPEAPVFKAPDAPDLLSITIPELEFPTLAPFDEEAPEFDKRDVEEIIERIDGIIQLGRSRIQGIEGEYAGNDAAVRGRLDTYNGGDYAKNRVYHRTRLFDDAAAPIDIERAAAVKKLTNEWAARNFSIVPGMLVGAVNDVEIEAGRKLRLVGAKINSELAKQALEDYQTFAELYFEIERNLIDLYSLRLEREVENEKLRVRAQIELFNAALAVFNGQQKIREIIADAYKAELAAALELTSAQKTLIDGAIAETAENEARMSMYNTEVQMLRVQADAYKAQVQASVVPIELYKATLGGLKAEADTQITNIEAYREALRAYAAAVGAVSEEIKAYSAEVQASTTSSEVNEANVRAYTTHIQESIKNSNAYRTFASAQTEVLNANLQAFSDAAQVNESFVRAQAAKITAQNQLAQQRASAYLDYIQSYSTYNKALSQLNAARMTYSLTASENAARAEALANQAQAESDKIEAGALAAKAQALSALAQGAMSAMHVSASASGSGSTSSSAGISAGLTSNWGGSTSKNESKTESLSA